MRWLMATPQTHSAIPRHDSPAASFPEPVPHIDLMGSVIIPALLVFPGSSILFGWAKPVPYNPYNLKSHRWAKPLSLLQESAPIYLLRDCLRPYGALCAGHRGSIRRRSRLPQPSLFNLNLFLGLFNLLPFPPLDGFTALRSALPWHLSSYLNRFEHKTVRGAGILSLILFFSVFSLVLPLAVLFDSFSPHPDSLVSSRVLGDKLGQPAFPRAVSNVKVGECRHIHPKPATVVPETKDYASIIGVVTVITPCVYESSTLITTYVPFTVPSSVLCQNPRGLLKLQCACPWLSPPR